jgi:hypothetical protein
LHRLCSVVRENLPPHCTVLWSLGRGKILVAPSPLVLARAKQASTASNVTWASLFRHHLHTNTMHLPPAHAHHHGPGFCTSGPRPSQGSMSDAHQNGNPDGDAPCFHAARPTSLLHCALVTRHCRHESQTTGKRRSIRLLVQLILDP